MSRADASLLHDLETNRFSRPAQHKVAMMESIQLAQMLADLTDLEVAVGIPSLNIPTLGEGFISAW